MVNYDKIIVLAGFSGAGKDSFAEILHKEYGFNFVTSHSTRPRREGESEGNPYFFVSKEEMMTMINADELIEYRTYDTLVEGQPETWYYAAHKSQVEDGKPYVCVLDMLGLEEFIEVFGDRVIGIFVDVPHEIREERAKLRGSFDKTEWDRRLEDDKKEFPEERIRKSCLFTVENMEFNGALSEILKICGKA
jgi:guanylate kinase